MNKVIKQRPDISFFIKMYPLPMHKDAYRKSKTILCENSLKLLEDVFDKKSIPDPDCETTAVADTIELAKKLGINSTPTLIYPDGSIVPGYMNADAIIGLIDKK
jgi:thiol:disulfide interchange protein DsbC